MLRVLVTVFVLQFVSSCRKEAMFSLSKNNADKVVAILPLSIYNDDELFSIKQEVSDYFHVHVIILQQQKMPQSFESNYEETFSADSILSFLSNMAKDSVVEVIGITHKNIYVNDELKMKTNGAYKKLSFQKDVFGLGYVYGNACIISDYRLTSQNEDLLNNRIRKAVFHEIGHNLGLKHCSNDSCLMSELNGNITVLNKPGGDFCERCKQKLR